MLRVIANQLKPSAFLLFTVFFLSNFVYLVLARTQSLSGVGGLGGIQVGIATASVMILGLFLREEQGKGPVLYRSLPLHHSAVVSAMYLLVVVFMLANVAYGLSIEVINARIGPWGPSIRYMYGVVHVSRQLDFGYAFERSVLARALAYIIVISVSIPLIVRYGSMWKILLGYLLVILLWGRVVDHLLPYTRFFFGPSGWITFAIVTIVAMICAGLSWKLSVWLYGQRDL